MKNIIIVCILILSTVTACELFEKETFPEPPENFTVLSDTLSLEFKVNRMDGIGVELSLSEAADTNNLYFLFNLSSEWIKGIFGLVLKDVSGSPILQEDTGITPDISRFEKDNQGNLVSTYPFNNLLVKDDEDVFFIMISYTGPAMPLIGSLEVEKYMSIPVHISEQFGIAEVVEFQTGKYGLDESINGFWIPVLLQ